jgi:hypothetical protein
MSNGEFRRTAADQTEARNTPWLPAGFARFYRPYG